jgi:ABC-2 type transport system permease protein
LSENKVQSTGLRAYFEKFYKYRHLLKELVSRDIKIKYRRSVLGVAWSVLNPLLMMLVITAVFSTIFKFQVENFPVYYLTGSLIFGFVTEATNNSMTSIIDNAPLIKKVYIPKYIFPLEKVSFAFVNALYSLIAVFIIMIILRVQVSWTIIMLPIPLIYTCIFATGLSLILATLNVFFRDIGHLYSVWTTAWMYLTPIIYPEEILPGIMKTVVHFNPMYYYVNYFRQVVLYGTVPNLTDNLLCIGIGIVFLVLGLWVFKSNQDKFILHI